jgi:hypothetical protein
MSTDRLKDHNWVFEKDGPNGISYESAQLAVLMDLRDELKKLNRLLHCPSFMEIPSTLRSIQRNMPAKKKRVKRGS